MGEAIRLRIVNHAQLAGWESAPCGVFMFYSTRPSAIVAASRMGGLRTSPFLTDTNRVSEPPFS